MKETQLKKYLPLFAVIAVLAITPVFASHNETVSEDSSINTVISAINNNTAAIDNIPTISVYNVTNTVTGDSSGTDLSVIASCDTGDKAVGGGHQYFFPSVPKLGSGTLKQSMPLPDLSGWNNTHGGQNTSTEYTTFVTCLDLTP